MPDRTVYRVAPVDEGWLVELPGDSVKELATSKASAVARALELARRAPSGGVIVVDREGRVEQELDVDPHRPSS